MSKLTEGFSKLKPQQDTGFSFMPAGRFVKKNGLPNVERRGINPLEKYSWYHVMLGWSTLKFVFFLAVAYIAINVIFALLYFVIGIDQLTGIEKSTMLQEFTDVFFFSAQTFTTVGYGSISPVGFAANAVATFEAFIGLLSFAIATGVFFGRFSLPQAFLKFSDYALISPYLEGKAIMFRLAPYKNNLLTDAEVILTVGITGHDKMKGRTEFFLLTTEIPKITSLSLSWTVVHKIDEESPFFGHLEELLEDADFELVVQIRAFDEGFANTVVQRTSYTKNEVLNGRKFLPMFHASEDQKVTVLDLDKINDIEKAEFN